MWNGARDLREVLPLLRAQQFDGEVEIVAIDSGSRDDSVALLRAAGARVWQIEQREFGHGKTRNFGVRQSKGDFIVFLSQDARPVGLDWLHSLVELLKDPALGAVYARQLARFDASPLERFFHEEVYPPRSRLTRPPKNRAPSLEELFFSNVCSATRRETALRFPFDETLIMSEDQLFARDVLLGGLSLFYAANVEVVHSHLYDWKTLFRRNFDSGYSMRGLDGMSLHRKIRRAARFWGKEARFLARCRDWKALSQMPIYEGARAAGLLAGGQGHRFPRALRRALSLHRTYWDNAENG